MKHLNKKGYDEFMKKIFFVFLFAVFCFSSCSSVSDNAKTTENIDLTYTSAFETSKATNPSKITEDAGGADITPRKYRTCYYSVAYPFAELVGIDEYWDWSEEYNTENPDDTNEMVIKKFVQYFNISRENFEKANLKHAKIRAEGVGDFPVMSPKDYADQEPDEIYNAEIIYTFNDEIINEYYLTPGYEFGWRIEYEEALKNGSYETRTTDWIDIEQMEAEIIAKYGEAEIVTEAAEITTEVAEQQTTSKE